MTFFRETAMGLNGPAENVSFGDQGYGPKICRTSFSPLYYYSRKKICLTILFNNGYFLRYFLQENEITCERFEFTTLQNQISLKPNQIFAQCASILKTS